MRVRRGRGDPTPALARRACGVREPQLARRLGLRPRTLRRHPRQRTHGRWLSRGCWRGGAGASAESGLRVMSFNVMCSICRHTDEIGPLRVARDSAPGRVGGTRRPKERPPLQLRGHPLRREGENRNPSAELVVKTLLPSDAPLLFAGDSNLRPGDPGFNTLAASFRDTFTEVSEHPYVANGPTVNTDGCSLDPRLVFPDCRVDHVLLSPGAPWRTRSWSVDVYKYARGFISDHRAIVVDLD